MYKNSDKLILGLIMALLFTLFTITFAFHYSVKAADEDAKGLNYDVIEKVYKLVKREFVSSFSENDFFNGSFEGIKYVLQNNRIEVKDVPVFKYDENKDENENLQEFNKELKKFIDKYKSEEFTEDKLLKYALDGMIDKLDDPYTIYLTPKEYDRLNESMSGGNFTGVGIYIELDREHNNQLMVTEPIEGTPAYEGGVKPGDWIIKINGKSTRGINLDDAVSQIRGPEGTSVILTIQRKDVNDPIEITLKRAFIHVNSVTEKMIDDNIGYLKLRLFGAETNREIDQAMSNLEKKGAKAFILDLRNNGGGYVSAAVDVSSKFLKKGTDIVSIKDRYGSKSSYKSYGTVHPELPLVLLVNDFSASASEITAGAIRDSQRGTLIGTKTFGKGSVQTIFTIDKGGAVKITTAHYFTPRGRNINEKGLKPDIIVEMDEDLIGKDGDIQLDEAVKYLEKQIK